MVSSGARVSSIKTIGLTGLKANILCERHNSLLSPLDTEAIRLQKHLSGFTGEVEDVYGGEGLWRGPTHFEIDGENIARWIVKTHCDFYADAGLPVPEAWVRYAFGRDSGIWRAAFSVMGKPLLAHSEKDSPCELPAATTRKQRHRRFS